jgi:hypothetical protein
MAVPFVTCKDAKLVVDEAAEKFLTSLSGPVSVVASIGADRAATRAALNHFTDGEIFEAEGGSGIRLWSSAEKRPDGSTLVVLDVPPFSDDNAIDGQLFSLAALVSSCLVYSSSGLLDDAAFNAAKSIMAIPKHLQAEEGQEDGSQLHAHFPPLFWLIHEATIPSGQSSKKYLDSALKDQSSATAHERLHFSTLFKQLDCIPTASGDQIAKKVLPHVRPKHLFGHVLDASMLLGLARKCVEAFNSSEPVVVPATWNKLQSEQAQNAMEAANTTYLRAMDTLIQPYAPEKDILEHAQERRDYDADVASFMKQQEKEEMKDKRGSAVPAPLAPVVTDAMVAQIDANEIADFDEDGNLRVHRPKKAEKKETEKNAKGRFDFWSRRRAAKAKDEEEKNVSFGESKDKMVGTTSKGAAKQFSVPRSETLESPAEAAVVTAIEDDAGGLVPDVPQAEAEDEKHVVNAKDVCALPVAQPKLERLHQQQLTLAQQLLLMRAPTAPDFEKQQLRVTLGLKAEEKLQVYTEMNAKASLVQSSALIKHLHSFVQYLEPVAPAPESEDSLPTEGSKTKGKIHGSITCRHIGSDISTYRSEVRHVQAEYTIRAQGPKRTAALASFMCSAMVPRMVRYAEHCNGEHRTHMAQMGKMLDEKRAQRKKFEEEKEETARLRTQERADFVRKHEAVATELASKAQLLQTMLADTGQQLQKTQKRASLASSKALEYQARATKFVEQVTVAIDPPLEGYLRKQGGKIGIFLVKNWKERFFRLENNSLAYWDSR